MSSLGIEGERKKQVARRVVDHASKGWWKSRIQVEVTNPCLVDHVAGIVVAGALVEDAASIVVAGSVSVEHVAGSCCCKHG